LNIFNAEKSVGGHVNKSIKLRSFLTESNFTWQLDVKGFVNKDVKF